MNEKKNFWLTQEQKKIDMKEMWVFWNIPLEVRWINKFAEDFPGEFVEDSLRGIQIRLFPERGRYLDIFVWAGLDLCMK
jgi:hypothetical protein